MKVQFMPRFRRAVPSSVELNKAGSCSAAALKVDPLSENMVSSAPRKFVKREKASKKLFYSSPDS